MYSQRPTNYHRGSNSERPWRGGSSRGGGEYRGGGARGQYRGNSNYYGNNANNNNQRGERGAYNGNYRGYQGGGGRYRNQNNNNNNYARDGGNYRGDRDTNQNNNDWEQPKEYYGDENDNDYNDGDDVIQLTLSQEQMVIYEKKKDYVRENLSVKLDDDDIARICHTCDFDEQKIDQKLANYATKSKYQGLEEYEWQTTQTRAEKEAIKRKKR